MKQLSPRPVVVVPVHKTSPTGMEIIALNQCGRCLGERDIIMLAPEGLDLGFYRELMPVLDDIRVPAHWMGSIEAYNRLMISPIVYQAMSGYTHMLVHEPDAIVLRDELNIWCKEPYDYIGAPWFEGYTNALPDAPIIGVGNFGLSLHKLDIALKITNSKRRWYSYTQAATDFASGIRGDRKRLIMSIRGIGSAGQLRKSWKTFPLYCDIFWGMTVPQVFPDFRLASVEAAVHFAWEALPKRCFEMCEGALPFGIHAWEKYDLDFLKPYLKEAGVELNRN